MCFVRNEIVFHADEWKVSRATIIAAFIINSLLLWLLAFHHNQHHRHDINDDGDGDNDITIIKIIIKNNDNDNCKDYNDDDYDCQRDEMVIIVIIIKISSTWLFIRETTLQTTDH